MTFKNLLLLLDIALAKCQRVTIQKKYYLVILRQSQRHFFVTISLDVAISASCNWSVAVFTTSLEYQESYLTLRNVTLQTRLSITRDFFRQNSTLARLYNAAASPASRLRSAGSLAIIIPGHAFNDKLHRRKLNISHLWRPC